jgi:Shikimate kinase
MKTRKDIIFLVGFMGVGKSYLGQRLAWQLNRTFIDTDQLIEEKKGKSISNIFSDHGEIAFRNYEKEVIKMLLPRKNLVVATGGGLPIYGNLMDDLLQNGITIYLEATEKLIFNRLIEEKENRPLLRDKTKTEIQSFISETLKQRSPTYEKAHVIFDLRGDFKQDEADFLAMFKPPMAALD